MLAKISDEIVKIKYFSCKTKSSSLNVCNYGNIVYEFIKFLVLIASV